MRGNTIPWIVVRLLDAALPSRPFAYPVILMHEGCGNDSPTDRRSPQTAIGTRPSPRGSRWCPSSAGLEDVVEASLFVRHVVRVTQHGLTWM